MAERYGAVKDIISKKRERLVEGLGRNKSHIGLSVDIAQPALSWLADQDWITPNRITVVGGTLGSIGAALAAEPGEYSKKLKDISGGNISVSENHLKTIGWLCQLGFGYGSDAIDGSVAELKERSGKVGYTKLGRLLDGVSDKVLENAGPLSILHFASESKLEKPGWFLYSYFSNLSTLIRASAISQGINIEKTGTGSRGDIEATFLLGHAISSPFTWRGKGTHGALLTGMRMHSAYDRWKEVKRTEDYSAIQSVKDDIVTFTALNIVGYLIGGKIGIGGSTGQFVLGLTKVIDVIAGEPSSYNERLSSKTSSVIFSRSPKRV